MSPVRFIIDSMTQLGTPPVRFRGRRRVHQLARECLARFAKPLAGSKLSSEVKKRSIASWATSIASSRLPSI